MARPRDWGILPPKFLAKHMKMNSLNLARPRDWGILPPRLIAKRRKMS